MNNAVWVQWIQHVSTSHWAARASVTEQAVYIWVIVRHEIDYHRPLLVGESVVGHTWVAAAAKGARFDRNIVFVGADGRKHVSSVTTWALLDRASGRPLRVPPELVGRFAVYEDPPRHGEGDHPQDGGGVASVASVGPCE